MEHEHVHALLDDLVHDEEPDTATTLLALRAGRRARKAARVRTTILGVAAAIVVLVLAGWAATRIGDDAARTHELSPAAWPSDSPLAPPTKWYPTVHMSAGDDSKPPRQSDEQRALRRSFEHRAAEVLGEVLPLAGRTSVADDLFATYRIDTPQGRYAIRISALPLQGSVIPDYESCAAYNRLRSADRNCVQAALPGGATALVARSESQPPGGPNTPEANFLYRDMYVTVRFPSVGDHQIAPPIAPDALLAAVVDARFVRLLDFLAEHPGLDGYEHTRVSASRGPSDSP
ncbi:hypothetical protein [Embleya sp. NBC_00896]|uniref:hypothetical protein n=1 Tax=Embleya sp. NBC_00896 TaxID=2975961 RepID=UPI00386627DD|nr:hypothetical protein OG928_03470 [Embleya sp. NBC_00896]